MKHDCKHVWAFGILASVTIISPSAAFAATATDTVGVSITITNACTIAVGAMAFGQVDTQAQADATAGVTVNCSIAPTAATVSVGAGNNVATGQRNMVSGDNRLAYDLYSTRNRNTAIGVNGVMVLGTFSGGETAGTIYGRIPSGQGKSVGAYTDTVMLTVEYTP